MGKEMRQNKELAKYQSELQVAENQRQEQYNADEWTRQFGMQEQQWQQHFAQETAFNSEQAKAERLRAVGVNPIHALSGGSSGVVSGGTSPQPSVSPRSGVSSAPAPFSESNSWPSLLNTLNDSIKNLSSSRLQESEKRQIDSLLSGQIKMQVAEIENKQLLNTMQKMQNTLTQTTLPYQVQKAAYEVFNQITDISLKSAQANYFDAAALNQEMEAKLNEFFRLHGEKLEPYQLAVLKTQSEHLKSLMISEAQRNFALARQANSMAENYEFLNGINLETRDGILSKFWDSVKRSEDENTITSNQAFMSKFAMEQAKYANEQKELVFWKDFALDCLGGASDLVGMFTSFKSMKAFQAMGDAQQKSVEAKVKKLQMEYNGTYSVTRQRGKDGRLHVTSESMSTHNYDKYLKNHDLK